MLGRLGTTVVQGVANLINTKQGLTPRIAVIETDIA